MKKLSNLIKENIADKNQKYTATLTVQGIIQGEDEDFASRFAETSIDVLIHAIEESGENVKVETFTMDSIDETTETDINTNDDLMFVENSGDEGDQIYENIKNYIFKTLEESGCTDYTRAYVLTKLQSALNKGGY